MKSLGRDREDGEGGAVSSSGIKDSRDSRNQSPSLRFLYLQLLLDHFHFFSLKLAVILSEE